MKKIIFVLLTIIISTVGYSQTNVRIMSYNLLNYPHARSSSVDISSIEPYYKKIVEAVNPDILVVVEMLTQESIGRFNQNVLEDNYTAAPVEVTGNGTGENDCAMFYKSSEFAYISTASLTTPTRIINEFKVVHRQTKDTLIIYGVHLKANVTSGDNSANLVRRAAEVDSLRKRTKQLGNKANYIVCGDFNILNSSESAFIKLLDSSFPGYFYDPLQSFGEWNNNSAYAATHSYSPTRLNTRFDMILMSQGINDEGGVEYVSGSFKIFGNDSNHFNKSVLDGTNYWFSDNYSLGLAITQASDHLPVYADFLFGMKSTDVSANNSLANSFCLEQNYPNPFNPKTTISFTIPASQNLFANSVYTSLKIYDLLGRETKILVQEEKSSGNYTVNFDGSDLPSGVYFYRLSAGTFSQTKKMILMK